MANTALCIANYADAM